MMKKLTFTLPLVIFLSLVLALPVIAAGAYRSEITITDTSDSDRVGVPVLIPLGVLQAVELGYLEEDGLGSRLFEGASERLYMVASDRVGLLIPVLSANQERIYGFETDYDPPNTSFGVVVGGDGYVTILDDTDLEPGDDFEIEIDGYVDTSAGSDKYLVFKQEAFVCLVSGGGEISVGIIDEYNPDANPETSSVDGYVNFFDSNGQSWSSAVADAGDGADDSNDDYCFNGKPVGWRCDGDTNEYDTLSRGVFLFDTSSLPDGCSVISAALSLYGFDKDNEGSWTTYINIYSSNPVSDTALEAGDYDSLGTTAFCDDEISYTNWSETGYNEFVLNSTGLAVISKTGVSKFGARTSHDVEDTDPGWTAGGEGLTFGIYMAEKGEGYEPTLLVTYGVTATGVSSGEMEVKTTADGTDLKIYIDDSEEDSMALSGASVPDNANDWLVNQNNALPYFDYYKHTVSDVLITQYQPETIVLGEEYSTGTATFENDSDAVVGAGTTWTDGMVGSLMRSIDDSSIWFVVESVEDATHLTLATNYSDTGGADHDYDMAPRLEDLEGGNEDGAITWGANSDLDVEVGGLQSIASYTPEGTEEGDLPVILPLPGDMDLWGSEDPIDIPWLPPSLVTPAAFLLGWGDNTLVGVLVMFAAIGVGVGVAIATGSALLAAVAVGVGLAVGASTGAVGWWVVIVFAIFGGTYIVAARSI